MLEQLLVGKWLEKRPLFAFIIGFTYTFIAILSAQFFFPSDIGVASLGFLTALLIPSLNNLLSIETDQEFSNKKFDIKRIWKEHYDILEVYFFLFIGILIVFMLHSYFIGEASQVVFDRQLKVVGLAGKAFGNSSILFKKNLFFKIFINNLKVLVLFFALSFVYGAGSIFFLAWNASVWGVVFGYVAYIRENLFQVFGSVMVHTFLEGLAYILAIIAGGIISKALLKHKKNKEHRKVVFIDGFFIFGVSLVILLIAALVEVF